MVAFLTGGIPYLELDGVPVDYDALRGKSCADGRFLKIEESVPSEPQRQASPKSVEFFKSFTRLDVPGLPHSRLS